MNNILIIPKEIVTLDSDNRILKGYAVEISAGLITSIKKFSEDERVNYEGEILYVPHLTLIPGFIQTHLHLCQTLFRGLADDLELLDWLRLKIFPYENAHNKNSLKISVQLGLNELLLGGTTTILDMGTLHYQEIIFEELINSGIKAFAGKCMMDSNEIFPSFKSSTDDELKISYELAKNFNKKNNGKINYAFAPRFVLSSSEKLLIETREMMEDFEGVLLHTHSSENKDEISECRRRFCKENIEYFDSINLLNERTVLAHCVHVNENEIGILNNKNVRVAHCPSANLKLGSGVADIPRYIKEGISVSLGADGAACNNNLSIFNEMKLASLIQKPVYSASEMNAEKIFRLATIEGAKALHIGNETGSIERGKKADLVLLNLENSLMPLTEEERNIFSKIVYSASRENVEFVMVEGEWLVKEKASLIYDDDELFAKGKEELTDLLKRV
jgi:cytosine/adenosine deaminase-related metal-dependent hydrolase